MVNIKYIVLLILSGLLLFAGCRKDPALPSGSFAISKVKSAVYNSSTGAADTLYYSYDSLGRQVMSRADTMVTTYVYTAGSVLKTISLADGQFMTSYTTNSNGLAIADSKGFTYAYDSLGYLTTLAYAQGSTYDSTFYTIIAGNSDTSVEHQSDISTSNSITITYTYLSTLDSRDWGLNFLGKQNTNLINTETVSQNINGSTYSTAYTYSYVYDFRGRVSRQIQSSGSATYTTSYTYY